MVIKVNIGGKNTTKALFSSEKNSDFAIVALSFLFDKFCPIIN